MVLKETVGKNLGAILGDPNILWCPGVRLPRFLFALVHMSVLVWSVMKVFLGENLGLAIVGAAFGLLGP